MKKNIFVMMLALIGVFTLSSCSKNTKLEGTTWKGQMVQTVTQSGVEGIVTIDATMKFIDLASGTMELDYKATVNGITVDSESDSGSFTYTFDGESYGTIYPIFEDDDDDNFSIPFTYDKKAKQITIEIDGYTFQLAKAK